MEEYIIVYHADGRDYTYLVTESAKFAGELSKLRAVWEPYGIAIQYVIRVCKDCDGLYHVANIVEDLLNDRISNSI